MKIRSFGNAFKALLFSLMAGFMCTQALAEDGFGASAGLGVYRAPVYNGSDDSFVTGVPLLQISYGISAWEVDFSLLDGLGISYAAPDSGFSYGIKVAPGEERDNEEYQVLWSRRKHSGRTLTLLKGTPNASTAASVTGKIGYESFMGTTGASVGYHPTSVEYESGPRSDETHHALLFGLNHEITRPIGSKWLVGGGIGLEVMNQAYADGWYTVRDKTPELSKFKAKAGLRSATASFKVVRIFTESIAVMLMGEGMVLVSDAARSPYTTQRVGPTIFFGCSYSF